MKSVEKQRGSGVLAMFSMVFTVLILALALIKVMPHYVDNWALRNVLSDLEEAAEARGKTPSEIRKMIERRFITNRIEAIESRDIKIKRDKRGVSMEANYERREPFMFNMDVVVHFNDMNFHIPGPGGE